MSEQSIKWYRCQIEKSKLNELMLCSDARGYMQVIPQLLLFALTTTLAYVAFTHVHRDNWPRTLPVLLAAVFVHGTFSGFLGLGGPVHELCHKTPFKNKAVNEFFLRVYSFISWSDFIGFRASHTRHHQVTVHDALDREVVLPQKLDRIAWLYAITGNPKGIYMLVRARVREARGIVDGEWMNRVMPESNTKQRAEHRAWARKLVIGQFALMALFLFSGHWFLIPLVNFGPFYCGWLVMLCGFPQHAGLQPDIPDFRLCCRTYTCSWLPRFLYWHMNYHIEHHMFPAVPFYNLAKLRKEIEADLPPAPAGLYATWREIFTILNRQKEEPGYYFVAPLPGAEGNLPATGERVADTILELEAAGA